MSPVTLPGDLVSPVAGALLRRGCPVLYVQTQEPGTALGPWTCAGYWHVAWAVSLDVLRFMREIDLAIDLSDPAGMDSAARWLATHHGLMVGATAPRWTHSARRGTWSLWGVGPEYVYESALTDPAEALRAACLAAVGRAA